MIRMMLFYWWHFMVNSLLVDSGGFMGGTGIGLTVWGIWNITTQLSWGFLWQFFTNLFIFYSANSTRLSFLYCFSYLSWDSIESSLWGRLVSRLCLFTIKNNNLRIHSKNLRFVQCFPWSKAGIPAKHSRSSFKCQSRQQQKHW